VEDYEWRPLEQGTPSAPEFERFKTGEIAVYNVNTGALVQTIHLTPTPGWYAHVIGFSPDGQLMYYFSSDHLYAVDLKTGQAVTKPKVFSPIGLIFSEQ
jgi:sugar lactone lactonase YvrE